MDLGTLSVKLRAELQELYSGLQQGEAYIKGYGARANRYIEEHAELWKQVGKQALLTAGAVGWALKRMADDGAAYSEEILAASKATGLTVGVVQELKYAAEQEESSFDSVVRTVYKLIDAGAKAQKGDEDRIKAFEMLGIKATDTNGKLKPGINLLLEMSDGLKKGSIDSETFESALTLIGIRGAREVLPFLMAGRDRLKELFEESYKFNNLSKEQIKTLDDYGDELKKVKGSTLELKAAIAEGLLPLLPGIENFFSSAADVADGFTLSALDFLRVIAKAKEAQHEFWSTGKGSVVSRAFGGREEIKKQADAAAEARKEVEEINKAIAKIGERVKKREVKRQGKTEPESPSTARVTAAWDEALTMPGAGGPAMVTDAEKELQKEKEKLMQDWHLEVIRMTEGETAYKLAALEAERKAIEEKYTKDKKVLDEYAAYYKIKLNDIKNTKSDLVSEFIGAFEWKPAALLAGGGRDFGSRAPVVSQQGNNTVLQLTVNVDTRSGLHRELDSQLDRLNIVN